MTTEHAPDRAGVGGDEITFRITSAESGGAMIAFDVRMPPGGGPPALHRHEASEAYRIERGELAFYWADEGGEVRRTLGAAGAVVYIPGGREHTIRNESATEAAAYVTFVPGAAMERFVRAAGELADTEPSMEAVLELAERHGVTITRPVPAA